MNKKNLIIVIYMLTSFLSLESTLFAYSPMTPSRRQKICFSNQRVLTGAIEMYEMDHTNLIETALPGGDFEDLENTLIKEKYLKNHMEGPEAECSYGFIRYNEKDYDVFCKKHGTIETTDLEKPKIPEYNHQLERPYSKEYQNKINAKLRDKILRNILVNYVFTKPSIVSFVIIIVLITIFSSKTKKKKNS